MEKTLTAQHVQKRYGAFPGVAGRLAGDAAREILALLGPNGAGKTTFIKVLATLLNKDGGQVTILGYDLDSRPRRSATCSATSARIPSARPTRA